MLRNVSGFTGYSIGARAKVLGKVRDFYFDDRFWVVRYIVVDTRSWLPGRKVLISPMVVENSDAKSKALNVNLTAEQVKNSPPIEADKPVSREMEDQLAKHFGWSRYWQPAVTIGEAATVERSLAEDSPEGEGSHLRSANEVTGYCLEAADGPIGRVEDIIVEDEGWGVRYLAVLAPVTALSGKKVLIAQQWITQVSWTESAVHVDVLRDAVKNSPDYDPSAPVNREYETRLYDYYGRPKYWL
jgi:hypothetical protein